MPAILNLLFSGTSRDQQYLFVIYEIGPMLTRQAQNNLSSCEALFCQFEVQVF